MSSALHNLVENYVDKTTTKERNLLIDNLKHKEKTLFDSLLKNEGDNKIARRLYNTSPSHSSYQSLKAKVYEKIQLSFLSVDFGCETQKKKTKIIRQIALCRMLEACSLRKPMVAIAKSIVNKCKKLDLWFESIEAYRLLSIHYAIYEPNFKLATEYREMHDRSMSIYQSESNVQWAFAQCCNISRTTQNHVLIKKIGDNIENSLEFNTHRMNFFYYAIRLLQFRDSGNLKKAEEIIDECVEYLDSLDIKQSLARNYMVINKIDIMIQSNNLTSAEAVIGSFLGDLDKRSHQYFRYYELLFKIYLHIGKFDKCEEMIVYLKRKCKKLGGDDARNRVLIYEMYLNIFTQKEINMRSISNNITRMKEDKDDILIPYKIGEIINLYLKDKIKLIEKIDTLKHYCYTHLKDEKYSRVKAFVTIIGKLISNKPYDINRLKDKTPVSNNSIEYVNYELVLELIKNKIKVKSN